MTIQKLARLLLGLALFAVGIVLTINANLGVSPWNTFHQGVSLLTGISFGQAIIIVGFTIIAINLLLGQLIGSGTLLNIILIGVFVDLLFYLDVIPVMAGYITGVVMLVTGMFIISLASFLYISAGLGTGPRDGLMVGLVKLTGKPVGLIRGLIEATVLLIGFLLGGTVGIGTLIMVLGIGPIIQFTFNRLHFDVASVQHVYLFGNGRTAANEK